MVNISVLCPTRGRPELLQRSVNSLLCNAAEPEQVEILLAVDPDDENSAANVLNNINITRWVTPQRFGYGHLEEYYNGLARQSHGTWLFAWNDDAAMKTQNWDTVIMSHQPALLFPATDGPAHCNAFPIWPAEWTRVLGHVGLTTHVDSWMQWVGEHLGVQHRVPIEVIHRIPDDETYREGSGLHPNFGGTFNAALAADVEKLRTYLQKKSEE